MPIFSSTHFIVSGLIFRSFMHFKLTLVYDDREQSSFILLHVAFSFSLYHLLKRLSFLYFMFLAPSSKIICLYVCGFIPGLSILFHWSVCLFFCQYHDVLIIVALLYNLKSGSMLPLEGESLTIIRRKKRRGQVQSSLKP